MKPMEGEMQMAGENQGRKFEMRTRMTGKRIGPVQELNVALL